LPKSKQIQHFQFLFNIVAETGNIVAENGNIVKATFDFVERIVRLVAFNNVASTLLLVWTGFNGRVAASASLRLTLRSPHVLCRSTERVLQKVLEIES